MKKDVAKGNMKVEHMTATSALSRAKIMFGWSFTGSRNMKIRSTVVISVVSKVKLNSI